MIPMLRKRPAFLFFGVLAVVIPALYWTVLRVPVVDRGPLPNVDEPAALPDATLPDVDSRTRFFGPTVSSDVGKTGARERFPSSLPDPKVPLVEQLPSLLERASRGDPVAACRVAFGVGRCSGYLGRKRFVEQALSNLDRVSADGNATFAIEALARAQALIDDAQRFCAGVDTGGISGTERALEAALPSLSARQKTMLAMMLPDGQLRRLQVRPWSSQSANYVLPQIIADNTVSFLNAGFAARDPLALEGLLLLHSPSALVHAQGIMPRLPDQTRFLAYGLLHRRLFGPDAAGPQVNRVIDDLLVSRPPEVLKQLQVELEAEAQRWAASTGLDGLARGQVLASPSDVDDPVAECDR